MNIKRLAYLSSIYITKAPLGFAGGGAELGVALRASERLIAPFWGGGGTFIPPLQKEALKIDFREV